jgi:hypothetical protein
MAMTPMATALRNLAGTAGGVIESSASLLANAGARSLLSGTSFGDNIMAALPDMIVSTIGNIIQQEVKAGAVKRAEAKREALANEQRGQAAKPQPVQQVQSSGTDTMVQPASNQPVDETQNNEIVVSGARIGMWGSSFNVNGVNEDYLGIGKDFKRLPDFTIDEQESLSSSVFSKIFVKEYKYGDKQNPPAGVFAEPFVKEGMVKAPGLKVVENLDKKGKRIYTLTGNVKVNFHDRTNLGIDKKYLLSIMESVNQSAINSNGDQYRIRLTFTEATVSEDWVYSGNQYLTAYGDPYVNLYKVIEMPVIRGEKVGAFFDPNDRSINIGPTSENLTKFLPHEIFHWMGLYHSGYKSSLMWPGSRSTSNLLRQQELINLVEGYRK